MLFEVSYKDISELRDDQLRELVAALCRAELSGAGLPVSAVTAGGNHLARFIHEAASELAVRRA